MVELETEATRLEVLVEETHHPDERALLPADYRGPELVAVAYAGQLAMLTAAGRHAVPLTVADAKAILEHARSARDEHVKVGADTALDRVLTTIGIRYRDPRGQAGSFAIWGTVNHAMPHALPPAWSMLLRRLRDVAGPLAEDDSQAWDHALTWMAPFDLGDVWRTGGVVKLPSIVSAVECLENVYLRVGQPPQRSVLYRMTARGGELHAIDDRGGAEVVSPTEPHQRRWRLPCGGGRLTFHHEWKQPARLVIRVDDLERGIYVQQDANG